MPSTDTTRYDMGALTFWDVSGNFTSGNPGTGWMTNNVTFVYLYTHSSGNSGHSSMTLNTTGRIAMSLEYSAAS